MPDFIVTSNSGYLTFHSLEDIPMEDPVVRDDQTEKVPPKDPKTQPNLSVKSFKKRQNKFMKLICSLPEGEYISSKIYFENGQSPDSCMVKLKKFKSAFEYKFPEWYYIWKLRVKISSDGRKWPYIHLLVGCQSGVDVDAYRKWVKTYWAKVRNRSVEDSDKWATATLITNSKFGYFSKSDESRTLLPFLQGLTSKHSFGYHNKKHMPESRPESYRVTESDIELVRQVLQDDLVRQAEEMEGVFNDKQSERIKGDACFHAFLPPEAQERLNAILKDKPRVALAEVEE